MLDLYQFVFTSIDIEIRNRFMADFVCSVYYDSFAKGGRYWNSSTKKIPLLFHIHSFQLQTIFYIDRGWYQQQHQNVQHGRLHQGVQWQDHVRLRVRRGDSHIHGPWGQPGLSGYEVQVGEFLIETLYRNLTTAYNILPILFYVQRDDIRQVWEARVGPHEGRGQVHGEGQCDPKLTWRSLNVRKLVI